MNRSIDPDFDVPVGQEWPEPHLHGHVLPDHAWWGNVPPGKWMRVDSANYQRHLEAFNRQRRSHRTVGFRRYPDNSHRSFLLVGVSDAPFHFSADGQSARVDWRVGTALPVGAVSYWSGWKLDDDGWAVPDQRPPAVHLVYVLDRAGSGDA